MTHQKRALCIIAATLMAGGISSASLAADTAKSVHVTAGTKSDLLLCVWDENAGHKLALPTKGTSYERLASKAKSGAFSLKPDAMGKAHAKWFAIGAGNSPFCKWGDTANVTGDFSVSDGDTACQGAPPFSCAAAAGVAPH